MLAENIAKHRKAMKMTQVDFAKALHVTQGAVSQWENNRTRPDTDQLIAIATLFCVSVETLTGVEDHKKNEKEKTARDDLYERLDKVSDEDRAYISRMVDFMIAQNQKGK